MPSKRPHRVIHHRHREPPCQHVGAHVGYHYGHCTACHEIDAFSIATTTVVGHLRYALHDALHWQWRAVLHQLVWAFTRATQTGEYRHGGYFDSRFPGWRLHTPSQKP